MFMSCVLVSSVMRCGAMTYVGSAESQIGVSMVKSVDPTSP